MKNILLIFLLLIIVQYPLFPASVDDNIYCMGNGQLAVYASKCNIRQLFGPPYSSPSVLRMDINDPSITVNSEREPGTAIWKHTLVMNGDIIGTIVDFVDSELPCLVRKFNFSQPISFTLKFNNNSRIIENSGSLKTADINDGLLIESPRGTPFYNDYPMPFKQYFQVAGKNNVRITKDDTDQSWNVQCSRGEGFLYFTGGPLYPDCISNTGLLFSLGYDEMLNRTRQSWLNFTSQRYHFEKLLPDKVPDRELLLKTIDDVAVNIKTQQASEGAVLAGYNYHLGYIRDQYGVSRCLLKLGYIEEAKDIMDFYWKIWQNKGKLHNAQGINIDAFHVHENDEVEITGYLIIQAFDYMEQSKDDSFIRDIFPMLEWAWNCQKRNLVNNMLPFNGDETYVAGGVLPRSALIDGSAESTLLFIIAGSKLIPWIAEKNLWNKEYLAENLKTLEEVKENFRINFVVNDRIYANNPDRSKDLDLPRFRHGVCESLQPGCEFFGWTQKNENNRYLCPVCFTKNNVPKAEPQRYLIRSVYLLPLYFGTDLFSKKEIAAMINEIETQYRESGRLPSRPDGNITVGYDYGLLLYNLTLLNNPLKADIYKKMLSLLDETGSWVEYYENDVQKGTRYRPWESAINLEAAIVFAESFRGK